MGGASPDYMLDFALKQLNIFIIWNSRRSVVLLLILAMIIKDIELPHRINALQANLR